MQAFKSLRHRNKLRGRNGDTKASALQSRLTRTTKQIQGLSMFIKSIGIDRLRVEPAMTGRFPSICEREQVSCAKRTENNLSLLTFHFSRKRKRVAFTLAEVLITLGIIGVVAALTIPTLIQNYRNIVVETKLKKFYTTMNQVLILSQDENGMIEEWDFESENFLSTYILPYINKTDIKEYNDEYNFIYFADGSLVATKGAYYISRNGKNYEYFFYPNAKYFDLNNFNRRKGAATEYFLFRIVYPKSYCNPLNKRGFEPFLCNVVNNITSDDDFKTSSLYGCSKESEYPHQCTALIWYNGWKIPKDYPFKVRN